MQPKNAGCPTKLLVKEQRTRMIIALQSDPRLDSTYWASLSLCAPPFLTMESTVVALWRWSWGDTMVCCEHVMQRRGDWPSFHSCYSFCGVFASRPPLAMLHHPLLPIFLLAQRSGGRRVEERLRLQMPRLIPVPRSTRGAFVLQWQVTKSQANICRTKSRRGRKVSWGSQIEDCQWKICQ